MPKGDAVYLGHMPGRARKAAGKVHGLARADFDVVTADLPGIVAALERIVPADTP